jgi:hypothetical protein
MVGDYRSIHNQVQSSGRVHSEIKLVGYLAGSGCACYVFRRKSNVAGKSGFSSQGGTAFRSGV